MSIASNFDFNTSDTFCSGFGDCRRLDSSLLAATVSSPAPFSSAPPSSDGLALPEIFLGGVAAHFASLDQIKDGDGAGQPGTHVGVLGPGPLAVVGALGGRHYDFRYLG